LLQKIIASQKTNTSHHIASYYLLYHLAKLLQKIIASQKNQHIASYSMLLSFVTSCNFKQLQSCYKRSIIASQKTNTSHHSCFYLL
jgi:hypothetical protein